MKRRNIIIIVGIVVLIAAFFVVQAYQRAQASLNTQFQTEPIARGKLTAQIGATGTVRANQSAILNWETTGQVETVNVAVGDFVQADDLLAELKPGSLPQNVILARSELVLARRELANLRTSQVAQAQAQLNVEQAQQALEDAEKRRTSKDYRRSSQATLDQAHANLILAKNALEQTQDAYGSVAAMDENSVVRAQALSALSAAQQNYDRALANYNYLLSRPDEQEVAQADAEVSVARANLQFALQEWERLKDGPDPEDIAAAEARIQAIEATLSSGELRAPISGTITEVSIKPGDQVLVSAQVASAAIRIDDLSHLLVDVEVPEVDINQVKIGQIAEISFDAILGGEYQARVIQVARVGSVGLQGAVNFIVTLELTNADESILPGMTAAVNIITSEIDDVLLVPNRAVRLSSGRRYIFILRDGQAEQVEIRLGQTSETYSQVVSGEVNAGDQVILNPPAIFTPGRGPFGPGG